MMNLLTQQMFIAKTDWDLTTFLTNSTKTLGTWFGLAATLIGVVCIAVSIWQITSGLMSHGKKQTNWAIALILLVVGGLLTGESGGFDYIKNTIAGGGQKTIDDLGTGNANAIFMIDYFKWRFFQ